ncbi:methyltransferase family protein [Chloroflexota bacterium]
MAHQHNDNLAGEHRTSDIGQLILFCLFIALWISDIFLKFSSVLNQYVPLGVKLPISILLLILAGYLAIKSHSVVFGKQSQSQGVIRKGVFRFVRHPMYFSEIILYLGLLFLHVSLAAFIIWVIAIFFLYYISRYEEKLLLAKFGEEYEQYMREVPMWLPRLYRKK